MLDRLKAIQTKFVEFWNRFTSKQKTLIVSISAAVIFTLVALVVLLNRTKYVQLVTFENTTDAASASEILTEAGIKYNVSSNGLVFSVDEKNESAARLVLGQNNIAADKDTSYDDAFNNSMSTTDSERKKKQIIYDQKQLEKDLQSMDGVNQASVHISVPDSSNSLLSETKESSASVMLTTTADFDAELQVEGIANFVATTIGNSSTDNVRIVDQAGNLLFGGETSTSTAGKAAAEMKIKDQVTASFKDQVRNLFVSTGVYNDAEIAANLDIDLDEQSIEDIHLYSDDAEEDTGPMSSRYSYSAENVDGVSGIPGTDSNDGTVNDYNILNGTTGNSSANVIREEYGTSQTTTVTKKSIGRVNTENSSVALVLSRYVVYDEAQMKKAGALQGTNFEAFQQENDERRPIDVDEETYALVEQATGISADRIQIQAYEVPLFYPQEQSAVDTVTNYLQFVLAILIVALLCFVVFKGMKPVEVTELEPELSVEALLATTKENQTLEDIEFSDKSATRQQIERFVDENPEQVALLLRNWLNDEWN
ncbi:MAG: flagellar M-ring protein FliF [Lachnospiraceae bacterium]|nr:flagellar M-ring protein FliF [Lachnospiraceae bacterium]